MNLIHIYNYALNKKFYICGNTYFYVVRLITYLLVICLPLLILLYAEDNWNNITMKPLIPQQSYGNRTYALVQFKNDDMKYEISTDMITKGKIEEFSIKSQYLNDNLILDVNFLFEGSIQTIESISLVTFLHIKNQDVLKNNLNLPLIIPIDDFSFNSYTFYGRITLEQNILSQPHKLNQLEISNIDERQMSNDFFLQWKKSMTVINRERKIHNQFNLKIIATRSLQIIKCETKLITQIKQFLLEYLPIFFVFYVIGNAFLHEIFSHQSYNYIT
ncbi:hypothetical protein SNEBB_000748, partial [Seison nebaliae]